MSVHGRAPLSAWRWMPPGQFESNMMDNHYEKALKQLQRFRIKELKEALQRLGLPKAGKKQMLHERLEGIFRSPVVDPMFPSHSGMLNGTGSHHLDKDVAVTIINDVFQHMVAADPASTSAPGPYQLPRVENMPPVAPVRVPPIARKAEREIRCPCGSTVDLGTLIRCEDRGCGVWQHAHCVQVPDTSGDNVRKPFICELCRLQKSDPFSKTVAHIVPPVKLRTSSSRNSESSSVMERSFVLSRMHYDMMRAGHELQVWAMLLNDTVPWRMHWPQYSDLKVNGINIRVLNRPGQQALGANGRDEGGQVAHASQCGHNRMAFSSYDARPFVVGVRLLKRRSVDEVMHMIPKATEGEAMADALARVRRIVMGSGNGAGGGDGDSDSDLEVISDSVNVNLRCPMTGSRIRVPGRFRPCLHMGNFDLQSFVEMQQRTRKWQCPLCLKNYAVENLIIDSFFINVTQAMRGLDSDLSEVELKADGTWRPKPAEGSEKNVWQWQQPSAEPRSLLLAPPAPPPRGSGGPGITLHEPPAKRPKLEPHTMGDPLEFWGRENVSTSASSSDGTDSQSLSPKPRPGPGQGRGGGAGLGGFGMQPGGLSTAGGGPSRPPFPPAPPVPSAPLGSHADAPLIVLTSSESNGDAAGDDADDADSRGTHTHPHSHFPPLSHRHSDLDAIDIDDDLGDEGAALSVLGTSFHSAAPDPRPPPPSRPPQRPLPPRPATINNLGNLLAPPSGNGTSGFNNANIDTILLPDSPPTAALMPSPIPPPSLPANQPLNTRWVSSNPTNHARMGGGTGGTSWPSARLPAAHPPPPPPVQPLQPPHSFSHTASFYEPLSLNGFGPDPTSFQLPASPPYPTMNYPPAAYSAPWYSSTATGARVDSGGWATVPRRMEPAGVAALPGGGGGGGGGGAGAGPGTSNRMDQGREQGAGHGMGHGGGHGLVEQISSWEDLAGGADDSRGLEGAGQEFAASPPLVDPGLEPPPAPPARLDEGLGGGQGGGGGGGGGGRGPLLEPPPGLWYLGEEQQPLELQSPRGSTDSGGGGDTVW